MFNIRDILMTEFPAASKDAVDSYLKICSIDDDDGIVDKHHILPKHVFPQYEDFTIFPWNCCRLSSYNHIMAHYWFAKIANTWRAWNVVKLMTGSGSDNLIEISEVAKITSEAKDHLRSIGLDDLHKQSISISLSGRRLSESHRLNMSASASNKQKSKEHKSSIQSSCWLSKRSADCWQYPLYGKLWELWSKTKDVNGNHLKYKRFQTLCSQEGIDCGNLRKLVQHFTNVINHSESMIRRP